MPSQSPIPTLLAPHLFTATSSPLTLLTSIGGATTNWLLLRLLYVALTHSGDDAQHQGLDSRVVLVSWLRDAAFWKEGCRKLGINIQNVSIIDALTDTSSFNDKVLARLHKSVTQTIERVDEDATIHTRSLVFLDGLDFFLAASSCSGASAIEFVSALRKRANSVIVTTLADFALVQTCSTPLETSHSAFALSLTHQAHWIFGLRELNTGAAKDVSGVLRISRGATWNIKEVNDDKSEDQELLYFVSSDKMVKIFPR